MSAISEQEEFEFRLRAERESAAKSQVPAPDNSIWDKLKRRGESMVTPDKSFNPEKPTEGMFNALQPIHALGEAGGAATDILSSALSTVYETLVPEQARTAISENVTKPIGRALQPVVEPYAKWALEKGKKYPVLDRLAGDLTNMASGVPSAVTLAKAGSYVAKPIANTLHGGGKYLYEKLLQPTGTLAEMEAKTQFGYTGRFEENMKGWKKFKEKLNEVGRERDHLFAKIEGKNITVDYKDLTAPVRALQKNIGTKSGALPITGERSVGKALREMDEYWMRQYPDGKLPFTEVQFLKEGLYKRNEPGYEQIKKALSPEIEKTLADGARKVLEDLVPEIGVINRKFQPLLEFYDDFQNAIKRKAKEKLSITNTLFNNEFLINKLVRIFKAVSPDKPYAKPDGLRALLMERYMERYDAIEKGGWDDLMKADPNTNRELIPVGKVKSHPTDMSARDLNISKKKLEKASDPQEAVAPGIVYVSPAEISPRSMVTNPLYKQVMQVPRSQKRINLADPKGKNYSNDFEKEFGITEQEMNRVKGGRASENLPQYETPIEMTPSGDIVDQLSWRNKIRGTGKREMGASPRIWAKHPNRVSGDIQDIVGHRKGKTQIESKDIIKLLEAAKRDKEAKNILNMILRNQ